MSCLLNIRRKAMQNHCMFTFPSYDFTFLVHKTKFQRCVLFFFLSLSFVTVQSTTFKKLNYDVLYHYCLNNKIRLLHFQIKLHVMKPIQRWRARHTVWKASAAPFIAPLLNLDTARILQLPANWRGEVKLVFLSLAPSPSLFFYHEHHLEIYTFCIFPLFVLNWNILSGPFLVSRNFFSSLKAQIYQFK